MKKLSEKASTQTIKTAAEVHTIRLQSHPSTESLAPPVVSLLQVMEDADSDHHKKFIKRMGLTGKLNYADSVLDDLVISLGRKVLDLVGGDRDDLRYRAAFPSSPSVGVEGVASAGQDEFVSNIIKALRANADLASLSDQADPIEAAHAEVKRLREERDAAYIEEGNAFSTLQLARVRLIDHIHANFARLTLLFPKKKRVIDSFFA